MTDAERDLEKRCETCGWWINLQEFLPSTSGLGTCSLLSRRRRVVGQGYLETTRDFGCVDHTQKEEAET